MVSVTFRWKIHFLGSVREISDSQKWEQPHFLMAAYSHPTYPQQITLMTRRLERRMLLLQSDPLKKKIHSTSHRFLFVLSGLGECSLYNLATSVSPSSVFPILFSNLPTTVRPIKIRSHHPIFSTNFIRLQVYLVDWNDYRFPKDNSRTLVILANLIIPLLLMIRRGEHVEYYRLRKITEKRKG